MCETTGSWRTIKLESVVEILDSLRVPVSEVERENRKGDVPYYGANGQQGYIDRALFNEDLILIAEDGGYFDEFSHRPIAYRVSGPSWVNNHAHVIRAVREVHQGFLFFALEHRDIRRYIAGGTRTKLTQAELRSIDIELPLSRCEQQRIAEVLESADESIRYTEGLVAKIEAARRAFLFQNTIGSDISERLPLGDYLSRIDAGWSPACDEVPPVFGEWGILKVSAVTAGAFDPRESKRLPSHLRPRQELEVRKGDVLVARANGVADLVGLAVEVGEVPPRLMLSDKTLRIVPREGLLSGSFLVLLLGSPMLRRQIMEVISGSSGQKNISQAQLKHLAVTVPPLHDQARVVAINNTFLDQIRAYQREVMKLRKIKRGLVKDLLTGRVRVATGNAEEVPV
jgi:type I restriction enzyme S subunit